MNWRRNISAGILVAILSACPAGATGGADEEASCVSTEAYKDAVDGRVRRAIRRCSEALRRNPESLILHSSLMSLYEHQGNLSLCIKQARQMLAVNPHSLEASMALGRFMTIKGNLAEAESYYRRAIDSDELRKFTRLKDYLHLFLAVPLYREGRTSEACSLIDRMLENEGAINEVSQSGYLASGEILLRQGKYEKALEKFKKLDGPNQNIYAGTAALLAGEFEYATKAFRDELMQKVGEDHRARYGLQLARRWSRTPSELEAAKEQGHAARIVARMIGAQPLDCLVIPSWPHRIRIPECCTVTHKKLRK